jgi:uroporphyrinogen decarboxylase
MDCDVDLMKLPTKGTAMTDKQNALEIIRFGNPERVTEGLGDYGLCYLGCDHEGYQGGGHHLPVGSKWTDIWGTVWHKEHADVMGFPRGNPLASTAALAAYRWPDPNDERICGRIYALHKDFPGGDLFLSGRNRDTLWEKAYMLVGMENMMVYFYTEPEFAREILHRIMDFQLGIAAHYVSLGIEVAYLGDDLGTQNSLIVSPTVIADFLVPEYKRLFEFYNAHNVLINFHSCGHIEPVLDTLMALGVDILNPIQVTANDLAAIRRKTQGRMALAGGISTKVLMEGPVGKIRDEVRETIQLLGSQGGYFCSPDQWLPFPPAHYEAFQKAVAEYGSYPLN